MVTTECALSIDEVQKGFPCGEISDAVVEYTFLVKSKQSHFSQIFKHKTTITLFLSQTHEDYDQELKVGCLLTLTPLTSHRNHFSHFTSCEGALE